MEATNCACGNPRRLRQRNCRSCHAAYMREWRKTHPLNAEQRRRDSARSYLGVYLRRGKITRQPCESCGAAKAEGHHDDYDKPLEVRWLCRSCHLNLHDAARETSSRRGQGVRLPCSWRA